MFQVIRIKIVLFVTRMYELILLMGPEKNGKVNILKNGD